MADVRDDILRRKSVESIYEDYENRKITGEQRNQVLREKAHLTTKDRLNKDGYTDAMWALTLDKLGEAWESMVEDIRASQKNIKDFPNLQILNPLPSFKLMYHSLKATVAPFDAFGEVNGEEVEIMALRNGAVPSLARALGITTEIGSGMILPVKAGGKIVEKGVRAVFSSSIAKKAGEKVSEDIAPVVFAKVFNKPLEMEGIDIAEIAPKIVEEAGEIVKRVVKRRRPPLTIHSMPKEGAWKPATNLLDDVESMPTDKMLDELATKILKEDSAKASAYFKDQLSKLAPLKTTDAELDEVMKLTKPGLKRTPEQQKRLEELTSPIVEPTDITGSDIFKDVALKFGTEITKGQLTMLRVLARDALKDKTQESEMAFARYVTAFFAPQTGEKINYSKQMISLLTEWAPEKMAVNDIRGAMQMLAQDVTSLSMRKISGGAGRSLVTRARQEGGFWPGMRSFYQNLLLPFSSTAAFIGNTMAAGAAILERASVSPTEGFYLAQGMKHAIGDGLRALGNTYRRNVNIGQGRFDFPITTPISGPLGRIINIPTTNVAAVDRLFTVMFKRGSYYANAAREAIENNYSVGQYVRQQMSMIGPQAKARELAAKEFAEYNTFQTQLGPFARQVQKVFHFDVGNIVPGMEGFRPGVYYWPFMRSGVDLVKYSWNRTPGLQFISAKMYSDILAGGDRARAAQGRIIMGNLMGFYFNELAKEGYITGDGPVQPSLRAAWLETHEPNSIWIGPGLPGTKGQGQWLSYVGYEPLSHLLSMSANFASIMDQLDDASATQIAHAITYASIDIIDQGTWWGEMGDFVKIVSGDISVDSAIKILARPAITISTGGAIGTRITKGIDPVSRDTRATKDALGIVQAFKARVPGYSKTVPPIIDPYGDPLVPAHTAGSPWFGILGQLWPKIKDVGNDPIKREGARLKISVGQWANTVGGGATEQIGDITPTQLGDKPGVSLTTEEVIKRQEILRRLVKHPKIGMKAMTEDNPVYNSLPQAGKRAQFQGHVRDLRNMASELLINDNKELRDRVFEADKKSFMPQLTDEQRTMIEPQLDRGRDLYDSLSSGQLENLLRWGDSQEAEPLQLQTTPVR